MFKIVTDKENNKEILKSIGDNSVISIDTETNSLNPINTVPLLIQLGIGNDIFIIDLVKYPNLAKYYLNIIKDSNKLIIMHNAKFDLKIVYKISGEWLRNIYDTMIAEVLINQGIGSQYYSLKDLTYKYTGITLDKDVRETFANHSGEFTNEQLIYSALDVKYLPAIMAEQIKKLEEQKQLRILELEMKLVSTIAKMEWTGILLDKEYWLEVEQKAIQRKEEILTEIKLDIIDKINFDSYPSALELATFLCIPVNTKRLQNQLLELKHYEGKRVFVMENINISSPKQVGNILKNIYNIQLENTNEKTLSKVKNNKFIDSILKYREASKKVSTYGSNFFQYINSTTGFIHPEFNQVGTYTGRFSSNDPNMQNIPKEKEYRSAFISRPGYKIITADYSQAELRLLSAVSGERVMAEAFKNGIDLHANSAGVIFEIPVEQVNPDQRSIGKTLNFAIVYGTSEYGLFNNFGIPIEKGKEYISKYFQGHPTLNLFIAQAGKKILKLGYSITPLGRKRHFEKRVLFEDYRDKNKYESAIKREGVNHIIQGGSADIIKLAMVDIDYNNPFGDENLRMLLQVHDELVIEVKEELIDDAKEFINKCMIGSEALFLGDIPSVVDFHDGDFWKK